MNYSALVLDIEGTVCPISFVKDALFPYFVEKVPVIVQNIEQQSKVIRDIISQFNIDDKDALTKHILDLVAADIKDPILKQLQGYIWAEGYSSGEIKAPVYPDAVALIRRHDNVYIYSSGSVKAQKLLFGHVADSDGKSINMNGEIKGYFDINTSGAKVDASSYTNILKDIKMEKTPEKVLFLSDNPKELDAAKKAGLITGLAIRDGNAPVPNIDEYISYKDYSTL
ncbi:similar to Saccharomyces cerevisiae YEL038W UTR4 Protein with sequence similarity to 2,3-diketo-5-methylthiopentyl-1-phosphate enolase-phosphatases, involved in methionine salvage [Maudiozyma saulgeensis]|uniref:Enolase-phosphatase E1 n=1 Tax=Maudiozyma saulgeensis TaxID=1789683 RepID=A0A1X7QXL8_9SACH|nr:similar to Saccharomyces cerevisiae YEL038W UTR4 Protein with sequence similarity to 2,3-diketo-5-methylthiopentyl-1-phosphate enolase-phosphatases, involved in methionine salvage [Kazachstania saulgeensis]